MEENIRFKSGDLLLEGLLEKADDAAKGVVVTHPHPLYGGDMYNHVVDTICRRYKKEGYTTLRFNFRGTGGSQGKFDNGVGEQDDVMAAIACLSDLGIEAIDLSGYSFGTWVNARIGSDRADIANMTMVSPPAGFMNFDPVTPQPRLRLVVTGSRDDIAPPGIVEKLIPQWNPEARFEILEGADHFYSGYVDRLMNLLEL